MDERRSDTSWGGLALAILAVAAGVWVAWEIGDEYTGGVVGAGDVAFRDGRVDAPAFTHVPSQYPLYSGINPGGIPPEQLVSQGIIADAIIDLSQIHGRTVAEVEGRRVFLSGIRIREVRSERAALTDVNGREMLVVFDDPLPEGADGRLLWILDGELDASADIRHPEALGLDEATLDRLPWHVRADRVRLGG